MLNIELDRDAGIAVLRPEGALSESDFDAAAATIDPFIEEHGRLRGLIINTEKFPGWESFGSLVKHIKFVKSHHEQLSHVAVVTDSKFGEFAESIGDHFTSAEVKHFDYDEFENAKRWIIED